MYQIEFVPEAVDDLSALRKFDLQRVAAEIEAQLSYEPTRETRNRRRLRPNQLAEWELRVDQYRVFYDVIPDEKTVRIVAVGFKDGSVLYIHGEKYEL